MGQCPIWLSQNKLGFPCCCFVLCKSNARILFLFGKVCQIVCTCTCPGKMLLSCSIGKNCIIKRHVKWKNIILIVVAIWLHWKLSSKWKPRPLRLPWKLFLLLFRLFSQSVDTISTISWSKLLMWSHCLFLLKQMQGRASAVGKTKIELAMTSFIQDGGQKLWFFITKESCKSLCIF